MALCKDPSLTYLNSIGYNVVKLPRVGIEPLDILGKDDHVERLGTVSQLWSSEAAVPVVKGPLPATSVAGQKSSEIKLSIGLKILATALGAMGAAVPEVSTAYSRAKKIVFTFTDVKTSSVDPLDVGRYLTQGDLASSNPFVRKYFDEEDTSAFIITEVLKSNSITVTATDDKGVEVGVDLPAIQQAVGAKVNVTSKSAAKSTLTYSGPDLLTFGFKCFGIVYENGDWRVTGAELSANVAFAPVTTGGAGPLTPVRVGEGRIAIR